MSKKSAINKAIEQLEAELKTAKFVRDQADAAYLAKCEATDTAIRFLRAQQKPRKPRVVAMNQAG